MKIIFLILPLLFSTALQAGCSSVNLKVGDKAPEFALVNQDGTIVHLSDFLGSKVALYFYPKDNTPGCTKQACSIRDSFADLTNANITVLGVSKGSQTGKTEFIKKHNLPFPLLSATQEALNAYGVAGNLLTLYFPKRRTFLINPDG